MVKDILTNKKKQRGRPPKSVRDFQKDAFFKKQRGEPLDQTEQLAADSFLDAKTKVYSDGIDNAKKAGPGDLRRPTATPFAAQQAHSDLQEQLRRTEALIDEANSTAAWWVLRSDELERQKLNITAQLMGEIPISKPVRRKWPDRRCCQEGEKVRARARRILCSFQGGSYKPRYPQ